MNSSAKSASEGTTYGNDSSQKHYKVSPFNTVIKEEEGEESSPQMPRRDKRKDSLANNLDILLMCLPNMVGTKSGSNEQNDTFWRPKAGSINSQDNIANTEMTKFNSMKQGKSKSILNMLRQSEIGEDLNEKDSH